MTQQDFNFHEGENSLKQAVNALGNSMIYEDQRGNFALAQQIAEQALDQARVQAEPEGLAEALIVRAKVHILQGEPAAAIACCQEVQQLVPRDANCCLQAVAYQILANYQQFNTFPGGGGASASELLVRWNGISYLQEWDPIYQNLVSQSTDDKSQFEAWLVYNFLGGLRSAKIILSQARNTPKSMPPEQLINSFLNPLKLLEQIGQRSGNISMVALANRSAADLYFQIGEQARAQQYLDTAKTLYEQCQDFVGLATCLMMQGDWYSAPLSSPLVWNFVIQDSGSEGSNLAWFVENQEIQRGSEDTAAAFMVYRDAATMFEQAQAPRGLASIQLRFAYLAVLQGDYPRALTIATQAAKDYETCGDRLGYWLAQTHLILCHIRTGAFTAVNFIAAEIGRWGATQGSFSVALGLGILLNRVARFWLISKGDYLRSLAASSAAEALFASLGADLNRVQALVDQGKVNQAIGAYSAALPLYEQALEELTALMTNRPQLPSDTRQRFFSLACSVYQLYLNEMNDSGMQRSAERLQFQLATLPGGDGTAAAVLNAAGSLLSSFFSQQSNKFDTLTEGIANWGLTNLGRYLVDQSKVMVPLYRGVHLREAGQMAEAQTYFKQALAAARAGNVNQRWFLEALIYATQKDYDAAATVYGRYLEQGGNSVGFVGSLLTAMNIMDSDREAQLQELRNHEQALTFYNQIKRYDLALPHFQQLQRLAGDTWWNNDDQDWLYLANCAELHEGLQALPQAFDFYDQAIQRLEARRAGLGRDELKTALSGSVGARDLYFGATRASFRLAENLAKAHDIDGKRDALQQAFRYAEQGKARALLDLMHSAIVRPLTSDNELIGNWRYLNSQMTLWQGLLTQEYDRQPPDGNRIANLTQSIQDNKQALQAVEALLAEANPGFYQVLNPSAEVADLDVISGQLPVGSGLLQLYFVGDDLLIWIVSSAGIVQYRHLSSIDKFQIDAWVRQVVTAFANRRRADDALNELSAIFLLPVSPTLQQIQRLYIVPYGVAHSLPFHALPLQGQPLGVTHNITYLPSASALQYVNSDQPINHPKALVIGNPAHMAHYSERTGFKKAADSLGGAELEARYVASLSPENRLLLREQATETAVRNALSHYHIIHFATHGILDEQAPLLSSVLLAEGEQLNLYELMGLHLDSDLVVLSACNTALGQATKGDDVLGLSRGMLAAGAKAVLVSLWPVDDEATTLLISYFFRQIYQNKATPADALHKAQGYLRQLSQAQGIEELERLKGNFSQQERQELIVPQGGKRRDLVSENEEETFSIDYSHPYYWAPFILVG